ncbi:MAG: acetyl-CoA hydrolase/transferase family protein [Tissierellia bacterium]|nr:acetyl-CoA hydrolase/transferase family protein [Tissierellia bacterium]
MLRGGTVLDQRRLRCKELEEKVMSAEEAAQFIKPGMTVGTSGFTPAGYPKAVPLELAKRAENGEELKLTIMTGASVGPEIDARLAESGAMVRRYPYQTNGTSRKKINEGSVKYVDMHLSHSSQQIKAGFLGPVHVAIIEAVAITKDGGIVPSTSVGNSNIYVEKAEKVIVEINTSQPLELEGTHDIYDIPLPPHRKPIPLTKVDQRIGVPYIPCDPDKIVAIVETDITDKSRPVAPIDEISEKMAKNLIEFLSNEVKENRLPENLLPLQSGVGSVANAVLAGLANSPFEHLTVFSEVLQDSVFSLIDCGKVDFASGTSITLSPEKLETFPEDIKRFKDKIILRPQEISNNPGLARRLGVIAMNTALEVDIYGNVNSTHVSGTRMMNGIGGSGDFTRGGYLSIFTTASTAKGGAVSSIVPMVSHIDHTEHDTMVIVTEQGVADLRGLDPVERAECLIEKCAHPDYKDQLRGYLEEALQHKGKHTPHNLEKALSWYTRLAETGTMKES